jgi:hypothetical protein
VQSSTSAWLLAIAGLAASCGSSHDSTGSAGGANASGGASTSTGGASTSTGGASTSTGGAAQGGGTTTGGAAQGGAAAQGTLSERYPDEAGLVSDPAVLFHDDFESGWGRWDAPKKDTATLFIESDAAQAHAGSHYLRSTVTEAELADDEYISSSTELKFAKRIDRVYWRFHALFKGIAPAPHHWVRMAAGTPAYASSGLANTVPPGDQGFWFDFDADIDDHFNFYVYWYKMRSGRCNDGSATPGCAGDQGTTYYYGNSFAPPDQAAFPHDEWLCIEIMAKANTVGSSDGALAFSINDALVGDYRPGFPDGTWLRDRFNPGGCTFSACTPPKPFEGFDFRSSADVLFKGLFLDAYYERGSSADKRAELEDRGLTVSDEQTVLYDDVVVATAPIGCGKFR